ncbi:diguanylate cyclase [Solidesulfovibrio fructosivorans JJ]]|uniref:diguanylate cyclase n=1 Tax=Solidesulfovibrio fructosivorans JJ] TaxID=596151 RepID=E1JU10_SOLFR|nr:sensor domain-containing diguanylate cyclase [Solidesulfovibrio fructosivorans]EFL52289.1 diguanylate cyclase [Solidesulfovibrio fructosivorans JJ]]
MTSDTATASPHARAGVDAPSPPRAAQLSPGSLLGVRARMRVALLVLLALPPALVLFLVEKGYVDSVSRMLGLWLAVALVMVLPLARLVARFVALGEIATLNAFCATLRRGEYHRRLTLPPERNDEHEILRLMRDLNWLAHGVETRETWLKTLLEEAQRRERHFADLSCTDALTGICNRRHYDETLPPLLEEAAGAGYELWLLLIDCDRFKTVNDTYGHPAGDTVLAAMGATLRESTREGLDLPFRLGGDEFAVILTRLPAAAAHRVAERIRARFAAATPYGATASIGIARLAPDRDAPLLLPSLTARCDAALYVVKAAGGNATGFADGCAPETEIDLAFIENKNRNSNL